MRYFFSLFFLVFSSFSSSTYAQDEYFEDECDLPCVEQWCVDPWCGRLSLGFSDNSGNSITQAFNIEFEAVRKAYWEGAPWYKWHIDAEYDFKEEKSKDTVNKGRYEIGYEHRLFCRWAARLQEEVSFDQKKDLHHRFATTAGVGYYVFEDDYLTFELTLGASRVDASYEENSNNEHDINLPMGWELEWVFFRDWMIDYEFEFSADVDDWERYRISNEIEVTFPITKCWCFTTEYEYIYLSHPSSGKRHYDGKLKSKLCYKF